MSLNRYRLTEELKETSTGRVAELVKLLPKIETLIKTINSENNSTLLSENESIANCSLGIATVTSCSLTIAVLSYLKPEMPPGKEVENMVINIMMCVFIGSLHVIPFMGHYINPEMKPLTALSAETQALTKAVLHELHSLNALNDVTLTTSIDTLLSRVNQLCKQINDWQKIKKDIAVYEKADTMPKRKSW